MILKYKYKQIIETFFFIYIVFNQENVTVFTFDSNRQTNKTTSLPPAFRFQDTTAHYRHTTPF